MGHSSAGLANNCTCHYHVNQIYTVCAFHQSFYMAPIGMEPRHHTPTPIITLAMSCPVHLLSQIYSDLGEVGSHIGLVTLRIRVVFWQSPAPSFSSHCTLCMSWSNVHLIMGEHTLNHHAPIQFELHHHFGIQKCNSTTTFRQK